MLTNKSLFSCNDLSIVIVSICSKEKNIKRKKKQTDLHQRWKNKQVTVRSLKSISYKPVQYIKVTA